VFLRSHPYTSQRIKMLQQQIPNIIERVKRQSTASPVIQVQKDVALLPGKPEGKRPLRVMCPVCRRIYTGSTNYCPYDGTELK